jgi:hypothetical protein
MAMNDLSFSFPIVTCLLISLITTVVSPFARGGRR